jgi:hydrogenase-4 component B
VAFALGQHDLKRLLAYHSVENIGIILIGVGFALVAASHGYAAWGRIALAGGLLHVWNHGLFKSLLFLGAGSVLHATGTRDMSRLGGLWRAMPWTAGLFALGAAAIAGLPPLNGFVSEWLVYLGLFEVVKAQGQPAMAAAMAVVLLAMTGALALACFVKVCGVVFLGSPRSAAAVRAHECGPSMRAPMLLLALACVAIGLLPALCWVPMASAAAAWHPGWSGLEAPASLVPLGLWQCALAAAAVLGGLYWSCWMERTRVRRSATWACGYAVPTPRMQYTAGSFAGIITEWFGWILRPEQQGTLDPQPFPPRMGFSERTPETVLERVVEPVARQVQRAANWARCIQHGQAHAYVCYVLAGLAALAVMVAGGDHP